MRDVHQEILFDVTGQYLVWDAPEGRPSSVTAVRVLDADGNDDDEAEFEPTGTVETSPNTTIASTSGYGQDDPTILNLTSGTGVTRGRTYLLTGTLGDVEWCPIVAITGATAYRRQPLRNSYAATSTFVSTRITAPVDGTWVADEDALSPESTTFPAYRVVWLYVVGGVTYRHQSFCDLVRYSARHTVLPVDVDSVEPGWIDRLPTDHQRDQGQGLIEQAFRAVRMDMLADAKALRWLRHLDVVNELVAYRAIERGAEAAVLAGAQDRAPALDVARAVYRRRYDDLIREPHVPIAVVPDGAAGAGRREPFFRR